MKIKKKSIMLFVVILFSLLLILLEFYSENMYTNYENIWCNQVKDYSGEIGIEYRIMGPTYYKSILLINYNQKLIIIGETEEEYMFESVDTLSDSLIKYIYKCKNDTVKVYINNKLNVLSTNRNGHIDKYDRFYEDQIELREEIHNIRIGFLMNNMYKINRFLYQLEYKGYKIPSKESFIDSFINEINLIETDSTENPFLNNSFSVIWGEKEPIISKSTKWKIYIKLIENHFITYGISDREILDHYDPFSKRPTKRYNEVYRFYEKSPILISKGDDDLLSSIKKRTNDKIVLLLIINKKGEVIDVDILKSNNIYLNPLIILYSKTLKFEPGLIMDTKINCYHTYVIGITGDGG